MIIKINDYRIDVDGITCYRPYYNNTNRLNNIEIILVGGNRIILFFDSKNARDYTLDNLDKIMGQGGYQNILPPKETDIIPF